MRLRSISRSFIPAFAAACLLFACAREQPESLRTVAAIEVPLRTSADRADLIAMLGRHARAGGLHVDDGSERWAEFRKGARPDEPPFVKDVLTKTIYISVWRGSEDDDPEVFVDDGGHQGRPWLRFLAGKHPELATRVRTGLLSDIRRRWPEAREVPVMPRGGLPLSDDLLWTGTAYIAKPERLSAYAARAGEVRRSSATTAHSPPENASRP
ncbi:hypothetical protein [Phenylobacterium sp.]|uniref:hypothetical protein n=1 Tax=Phenylobacterium sp. TaxID=1871053 RepID=UPI002B580E1C|nr:hypothetical protein [Phenylobacterium sp.]HVI31222.1 hypothetical protein [Phenylobacterium sp.]